MQGILVALIPALIVSTITAFFAARFALSKFYSQRWWEKKAEAYSNILEQLSYLQYYFGVWFNNCLHIGELSSNKKNELAGEYSKIFESLKRSSAMGSFIISDDASVTLENLLRDLESRSISEDWARYFDDCYGIVKDSISLLREYAKKDLKK